MDAKTKPSLSSIGELRDVLARQIEQVETGIAHLDRSGMIVKLAAQINASFAAEVEVLRLQSQLERQVPEVGHLAIKHT